MLNGSQLGFCRGESTMDVLVRVEHTIRKCLSTNSICIVVYIDLKSAFDTVWVEGLMWKLIQKGIKGNMIQWVYHYFKDRKAIVRVEGAYSDTVRVTAGTPQGAVLSPLLFNLMMSDMPEQERVEIHVYADDITVTSCGSNLRIVKRQVQTYLKEFMKWADTWGFKINISKTFMQYYTRRRMHCPVIKFNNQPIKYKKIIRY